MIPGAPVMPAWAIAAGAAVWLISITLACAAPAPRPGRTLTALLTAALTGCAACAMTGLPLILSGHAAGCWLALGGSLTLNVALWCVRGLDDPDEDGPDDRPDTEPDLPGGGVDWDDFDRQRQRWARPRIPAGV